MRNNGCHQALLLTLSAYLVVFGTLAFASQKGSEAPQKSAPKPAIDARPTSQDRALLDAEMEQLAREIQEKTDPKHPKRRFISASTQVPEYREYIRNLNERIEITSRAYNPYEARGLSGSAIVTISIGADGSLLQTTVNRSSGHSELDRAAIAIVRLSAPFDALPVLDGV